MPKKKRPSLTPDAANVASHFMAEGGPTTPAVKPGEYGAVYVIAGEHEGQTGYYDDDDDRQAIVYFREPILGEYVMLPHRDLIPCPERLLSELKDRLVRGLNRSVRRVQKKRKRN